MNKVQRTATVVTLAIAILAAAGYGAWRYRGVALDAAVMALKTGDYSRAIERLQPWANVGDSDAQFMLGQIHAFGWGVPKDDDAAINWFRRAGKFREPNVDAAAPAEFYVGVTYLNGHGVQKDGAEAKRWFARSAQGGFRKAAAQLESMTTLPKTLE